MRIGILTQSGVWGGLEVHAVGLVRALNACGHDAFLVCLDETTRRVYERATDSRPPLVELDAPWPVRGRTCYHWRRILRRLNADACVVQKNTYFTGSLGLLLAARSCFRRLVTVEHLEAPALPPRPGWRRLGGLIPVPSLWWYRWWLSGYFRSLPPHVVVTVSGAVKTRLRTDYGIPEQKITVVHNGVDSERFRPDEAWRRRMRSGWGLSNGAFVFGFVGRLVPEKGPDLALRAFARVRERCADRDLALVFVGEGPEQPALERRTQELGLGNQVVFAGFCPEPQRAYAAFDAIAVPSRMEALGISLLEGMATGCCPIAAAVGGIPEILSRAELGHLVPPNDSEALAQAMLEVARTTPAELTIIGQRVRRHVTRHFDARSQFAKIAALFDN